MNRVVAAVMLLFGAAQFAHAAERIVVTSVGPDRYKVSVEREYLTTQDCHERADHTAATIDGRRLIFVDTGAVCTVEEVTRGH